MARHNLTKPVSGVVCLSNGGVTDQSVTESRTRELQAIAQAHNSSLEEVIQNIAAVVKRRDFRIIVEEEINLTEHS
jgi:hypothetical protein